MPGSLAQYSGPDQGNLLGSGCRMPYFGLLIGLMLRSSSSDAQSMEPQRRSGGNDEFSSGRAVLAGRRASRSDPHPAHALCADSASGCRLPRGRDVRVTARHVGSEVIVSVADEGLGIPADSLPACSPSSIVSSHLNDVTSKGPGWGSRSGARLSKRTGDGSGPNQGSTFSFALPLIPPEDATTALTATS